MADERLGRKLGEDDQGRTQHVVQRTSAREVLDQFRTHAGNGKCSECGHVGYGDGHIATVAMLLDGVPVDVLALAVPDDDLLDVEVTPLALVLTPELVARLTTPVLDDEPATEVAVPPAPLGMPDPMPPTLDGQRIAPGQASPL